MKYIAISLCIFVLLHAGMSSAQTLNTGRPHAITMPQFTPVNPNDKYPCKNAPFFLTLGPDKYKVVRLAAMQYVPVGSDMPVTSREKIHPSKDCTVTDGGAVTSFSTGFIKAGDVSLDLGIAPEDPRDMPPSTYTLNKENLDVAKKDQLFRQLPYGVAKVTFDNVELYVFPKTTSPTLSGEPAVLYCAIRKQDADNLCKTAYQLPDGRLLSYYFTRGSFKEDMYASVDKMVRERIETMKVKAEAPQAPLN